MSGNKYLGKRYAVGTVRMSNNQSGNMWQSLVLLEIQPICVLIHCIDMIFSAVRTWAPSQYKDRLIYVW